VNTIPAREILTHEEITAYQAIGIDVDNMTVVMDMDGETMEP
jgi:hypothetical protein